MKSFHGPIFALAAFLAGAVVPGAAPGAPLTTLDYRVTGQSLQITPAALAVPKNIAGSVATTLAGTPPAGSYVEAFLRGPSFPARRLVGAPGQPLLLPSLNLVGDYSLDGIRLADGTTNETLLEGTPSSVPVHVFDEVLISRVTSRPLTLEEIQGKGIVIDEQNFRAIEFEVGFVLDGVTIPVRFPVVAPAFTANTEIIPTAELEERLRQAEEINQELSLGVVFPPALETARHDVQVKGLNFQFVDPGEGESLALTVPPIPALMVIPGSIGFLNQFFSVLIFTENGAPAGSGLVANNIAAELVLPPGPDRVPGSFAQPGDDPLRFARVGEGAVIQPVQPVRQPGPDGNPGTADDLPRLQTGETGQGEFLVEGLQEGLHVMDLKLTADLEGLAAGVVKIEGRAAGSVLVRNPKFSFAFAHPRTVRAGEPYEAFVTILNTSQVLANLVNVTLNKNSISGGILESDETVQLGTILPGQTATAKFRIRSQRTGAITFSNITTSEDSLVGRFRLHAGVDERGVALSPDTLVLPNFVDELPADLLSAANRVLGQALSVAKAGQTPPGVLRVGTAFLKQKALELAEAGQRLRYGEPLATVLPDLLLDWQGAREFGAGWDQILRETNAGLEWRQAVARALEDATPGLATSRLLGAARNLAGRGETWFLGAVSLGDFQTVTTSPNELNLVKSAGERATLGTSTLAKALGYPGRAGAWIAGADAGVFQWKFAAEVTAPFQTSVVLVRPDGTAVELLWRLDPVAAGACMSFDAAAPGELLAIDDNCDGTVDRTLAAQRTDFTELPPAVLAVRQEPEILVGRPSKPCPKPTTTNEAGEAVPVSNYANVLAVLFNKPMTQSLANVPAAYTLEGGNEGASVQMQPGGRVALLTTRRPVGNLIPRTMSVAPTVTDARGNPLVTTSVPVQSRLVEGVIVRGRVVRADGSFPAGVPVTLTYYDEVEAGLSGCLPFIVRSSQVFTDAEGQFQFDLVLAGIAYSVSATDTSGLSSELISTILESTHGDSLDRGRLLELATSAGVQDTLLAEFSVGALPQAIARAEGLDRALVRDHVGSGSPREGTTAVYALRFRGRGAVIGQVLAADGTTSVANAAVNLFPDPSSRELGRGLLSDGDGRFAFFGVPLGPFSVEATSPAGPARVVSDIITTPGETKNIAVVLSASAPPLGELQGRVTEPDGTPHAGASVFVGRIDPATGRFGSVVAIASVDTEGYWRATNVTAVLHDLVALSADGKRMGQRHNILTIADAANTVNLTLQARATVTGRVETSTGIPVANALVGGGEALVRTDPLGRFTLTGVPTGDRQITAALERDSAAGIDFPRTGSGGVNVLPGAENFVIVRLVAAARIIGRVLDETGAPMPGVDVSIPQLGGFFWVYADAQGNFEFAGLELGSYEVSAPAPPHEDPFNGEAAARSLLTGTQDEMLATIGEAFAAFTGVNNPLLNGEGTTFTPSRWGFRDDVKLEFDGQTVVADVRLLGTGTIGGVVKNGQGVPIGARVRLTGIGPSLTGGPTTVIRGERDSDPALGTFEFPDQALVGDWGLQAASPFFPVVISTSGRTTTLAPDDTDNVLQFPSVRETNGGLAGLVLLPDGSPAGAGIKVQISFGPDFIIQTGADSRFATQPGTFTLPATDAEGRPGIGYTVTATDEVSGATGRTTVTVMPSQVNSVTVRLLGRGDAVVTVVRADGTPAGGAAIEIQGGAYPLDRLEGTTNAAGQVTFQNLFDGPYGVCASLGTGLARIAGRINLSVISGGTATATLTLGGTGTVRGTFFAGDGATPVPFANVALGVLAFNSTGADGRFEFPDVPLGTFRLIATDAVTGRSGSANVTLSFTNETRDVRIVETALGDVFGRVVNALGTGNVPSAEVSLSHSDPFVPPRTVTTGPDGSFRFPGTPAGVITLEAADPVSGGRGTASATLPQTAATFEVNVALAPVANLTVTVFEPDGTTPAGLATVRILRGDAIFTVDTDALGGARFEGLALTTHRVIAESRAIGFTRRWAGAQVRLTSQGAEEALALTLRGVGSVTGTVFGGDGITPAAGAQVSLTVGNEEIALTDGAMTKPSANQIENVIASAQGQFTFSNIPTGDARLAATAQALGASEIATVVSDGQTVTRNLTLSASGTVVGRIVRADGTTPAAGTDVLLTFTSQSGLPGRVSARTLTDGLFSLAPIPVGAFHAGITNASFGGIALRDANVTSNHETVDLGDLVLDEAFPAVVQTTPPDTATGVSTTTTVEILFSEALALASIEASGVFIRRTDTGALVPATLTLAPPPGESALRLVRLVPLAPLASETTHQIVVVDGELLNALGEVTNRGPRDRVGRPLVSLFSASFTTRDGTPPTLLSFTPENGAEGVDGRTPIRLSFDEAIQPGAVVALTGPAGPVAGTTNVGLNSLVLTFVPSFDLPPNNSFTAAISGVKDLAGNDLAGQPRTTVFSTLDTLGPVISTLRLKNNPSPLANTPVTLETLLAMAEPGVRVRFTAGFNLIGTTATGGLEFPFTLPAQGTVVFRAIAIDRFGNEGPVAALTVPVQENQPPTVTFTRLNPLTGPIFSGSGFSVRVNVADDGAVTDFRAAATGAAIVPLQSNTTGAPIVVQGVVPTNAVPGTKITLIAQGTDNSGRVTGEQRFEIDVADGTAPTLSFVSPALNAIADPAQPFAVAIDTTDNSGDATLEVTLSGGVTGARSVAVDGTPNFPSRSTLTFDLSSATSTGGTFTATARATDAAGRVGIASRAFSLPDRRAPQLASTAPGTGAGQQSLWTDVVLTFDEAMKPETFTPANLEFPGGFTFSTNASQTVFTLRSASAFVPGQTQSIRLKPGLTDVAGNPWQDAGGAAVPPGGKLLSFTTAAITAVLPAANTKVVPGQTVTARADFESGLGADQFAFQTVLGAEVVATPAATRAEAQFTISLLAAGNESLFVVARKSGRPALTLPTIPLDVRARADDDDGDGITNGQEADAGLDPFFDDRTLDPDGDGRNNAQEILAGTNPTNPDSDGDGLNDGAEFAAGTNPLLADTDADGLKDSAEAAFGANPLLADTDGDTLNDGFEVGVGRLSVIAGSFTWAQAKADAETRGGHLFTVTSAAEQAGLELVVPNASSVNRWIGLSDQFIEGAFAWVTGEPATLLRFGPGEPNNVNDEDGVLLRTDGLWNDAPLSTQLTYVFELGFFTSPAQADTDGDGIGDALDIFPGQQNRAPIAGDDSLVLNAGEARVIGIATELLADDTDPDGTPVALTGFTQPAAGGTVTQASATTLQFTPAGGFSGVASFDYTITDPNGLTATATVNLTVGTNSRPVAGNPGVLAGGGFALEFDGNDDFVAIPKHPTLDLDQFAGWTVEAWVKPTAFNHRSFPVIYAMGRWAASLGLDATSGGFDSWINDSAQMLSSGAPPLGEWTHIALVHDGTTRRFFINGQLSGFAASVKPAGTVDPTRIGAAGFATPDSRSHFRGTIDEVRVWSRALDAAEINETLGITLTGAEDGLTAYWPFEEGTGTATDDTTANANVGALGTTPASAPQWVASDAPILTRGQEATTLVDTPVLLPLIGSDPDNAPLTARILTLPGHGRLFQFAGGAVGAEITAAPANIADTNRRVVYQPESGYVGADVFRYSMFDGGLESFPAHAALHVVPNLAPSPDDLWDVSKGATITASSGFLPNSSGGNMFGAATGVEPGNAIFADGHPAGFTHFIEWETPSFLFLEGAGLFASDDGGGAPGGSAQRGFTEVRLLGRMNDTEPFTLLTTFRPGANPYFNPVRAVLPFAPFIGREFRAEFDQFGNFAFPGPRIQELDAIGETVVLIPTPAQVVLQNATADRTQGGFNIAQLIDGIVVGGAHGWAGDVGGTPPMTAVFETAQSIGATIDTEFVFGLPQPFGGQHFIGNFRLSATTDTRDQFADGLGNGGDITANWTVLDVVEVTSTGGETLSVLPDGSVLVGGAMPATTAYTVRARGISGGVTGFRLELLEHPSLPNNGPGRVGHGNWVLAEFTVDASGATLVPNRAPHSEPDTAQTPQNFPVTTGDVLVNDTDSEGDTLAVFDFTQPAAGTGSVVNNGDGTFTYTPPDATFTGTATFKYRATDSHQPGGPATVSITVNPSSLVAWNNPAGGNWSTASNWSPARVPAADDVAVINLPGTYAVTLNTDASPLSVVVGGNGVTATLRQTAGTLAPSQASTVAAGSDFRLEGGTLRGTATLSIHGSFSWTGGAMRDAGKTLIAEDATGTISGGGQKDLAAGRILENAGTLTVSGGTVFFNLSNFGGGAVIDNLASGTLEVQGETDFSHNFASPGSAINNAGLFRKTGGGETRLTSPAIALNNTGTMELVGGSLKLEAGGNLGGTVDVQTGGTLVLDAGTFVVSAGSGFIGTGEMMLTGGSGTFQEPLAFTAPLTISGGNWAFDANQTFSNYTQTGGTLRGTGTVSVTSSFSWTGGAMRDAGKTVIASGATGTISGGGQKDLAAGRILENAGTLTISGGTVFFNLSNFGGGASIDNVAGGTLEVQGETDFSHNFSSPGSAINNAGLLLKTGGGDTRLSSATVALNNTGTVEVVSGSLTLEAGGSNGGTFTSEADSTVDFAGGTFTHQPGAVVTLGGGLSSSGGTVVFNEPTTALGVLTVSGGNFIFNQALTSGDTLNLSGGTVRFEAPQSFANYTQTGGALLGTGTVSVTNSFSWTGGAMRDAGRTVIAPGATGTISGGGQKDLAAGRILENAGTLTISGGTVFFNLSNFGGGGVIDNVAGGTLEVQGETDFSHNFSSPGSAINNAGLLLKTGGGDTRLSSATVALNNTGTVEVVSGSLTLEAGGSNGGTFTSQADGTVNFAGGTFTHQPGAVVTLGGGLSSSGGTVVFNEPTTALGVLTVSGGNFIFNQALTSGDTLNLSGGTVRFEAPQSFANYTQTGGALLGTGTVSVTSLFSWTGGAMRDAGRTVIAPGATGTISGGGQKDLAAGRILENAGTLTISGGTVFFNLSNFGGGAVIDNVAGGTLEVQGETDFSHNFSSPGSAINNAGLLIKTGGGETRLSSATIALNNTGTVEVVSGTLTLEAGGSNGGTFTSQADGTVNFAGGTFTHQPGAVVTLGGGLSSSGGTVVFNEPTTALGALTLSGGEFIFNQALTSGDTLNLSGGTVRFEAAQTFATYIQTGGSLRGAGTVSVTNSFSWTGGAMRDAGKTLIADGATGTISGGGQKDLAANRILENAGTLTVSGGTVFFNLSNFGGGAVIDNLAGGTLEVQGETDFSHNFSSPGSAINNAGLLLKTGGGETHLSSAAIALNNTGTIEMISGSLSPEAGFAQNGLVRGSGTLIANLTNNGTMRPDPTPGGLAIQGNFTQTAAGRLELTLAGADAAVGHRSLRVTGTATLAGTLEVALAFPFNEPLSSTFPIVSYASRSGDFASASGLTGNFGYDFTRAFSTTTLDLTVSTKGDGPPPPAPALAPAGFADWMEAVRDGRTAGLGAQEDPDGDGVVNFLEYAFGTPPFSARPAAAPKIKITPGATGPLVSVTFRQRAGVPGLHYVVEMSRDGRTWSPDETAAALRSVDQLADGADFVLETHVYELARLDQREQFFRVRVSMNHARAKQKPAVSRRR